MIEEILLPAVAAAEEFGDRPDAVLFPEEEAVIGRAVEKRRREFTTGRACARAALARLGQPPVAILPGERGSPGWPPGIVGSITHCAGYRAAAVARASQVLAVGLDAEPDLPLPRGVLDVVSLAAERASLADLARSAPGPNWDRMLFCAKESVYKAWFPLTGRWLGFEQAHITLDPAAGAFTARLLVPGPEVDGRELTAFDGRWLARGGLILTAISVAR
ncbi:MAG TPA: 4'-phosphopantetheinyl transferase superfamily protein [Streptosporangiaceae bacterium]